MKRSLYYLLLVIGSWSIAGAQTNWVSAYYAGWAKWNATPVDIPQIDFSCATHWIFFTMAPTASGSFDGTGSGIDTTRLRQFALAAHAAGRKAVIGTGGWGSDYTGVVTNPTTSINYLTGLMRTYGYDGVDIDWEPVPSGQYTAFASWVKNLKAAMQQVKSDAVLSAAALAFDQALVNNQQYLDQINLMTYDMSGPWPGWVSWHNSAIYDGGNRFPSTGALLPSIDGSVSQYENAGVPASKLGFGIEFYGYIWNGVTAPLQTGFGTVQNTVPYSQIMDTYGGLTLQWDAGAQAAYYSGSNQFVSFDADTTIGVKANYMRAKGLGGVIVYEVAAAYRDNLPAGYKDHLLKTVKQAFMGGAPPPSDSIPPTVSITSPANGAVLSGQVTLQASASDNSGVVGVQFEVDGHAVGQEDLTAPYSVSFSSWQLSNGEHTISAVARDWAGNKGTATISASVANSGPPPVNPDMIVYDDVLKAPFTNTSWGATVDFSNTTYVSSNSSKSAKVDFNAWGGFDLLDGTWQSEQNIDVSMYDSLTFDVYATAQISLTIGYYVTSGPTINVSPNAWHTFSVALPADPFSRFYFQSGLGSNATVYFDNIRFDATQIVTGVTPAVHVPRQFALDQNYPNPFNPSTTIRFTLPQQSHVDLKLFDLLGNEVATLVNDDRAAGTYSVVFDAGNVRSSHGSLASGIYFYRLTAGNLIATKRLILLK